MSSFDNDIARLSANAAAMLEREKSRLAAEFATIDRLQAAPKNRTLAPTRYIAPTAHDRAQTNPMLRQLLRDLQTGRL